MFSNKFSEIILNKTKLSDISTQRFRIFVD